MFISTAVTCHRAVSGYCPVTRHCTRYIVRVSTLNLSCIIRQPGLFLLRILSLFLSPVFPPLAPPLRYYLLPVSSCCYSASLSSPTHNPASRFEEDLSEEVDIEEAIELLQVSLNYAKLQF